MSIWHQLALVPYVAFSKVYYVDPNAANSERPPDFLANDGEENEISRGKGNRRLRGDGGRQLGSWHAPFSTVQQCVERAKWDPEVTSCTLHDGVYRENVHIDDVPNLKLVPLPGAKPIFDGSLEVHPITKWSYKDWLYHGYLPDDYRQSEIIFQASVQGCSPNSANMTQLRGKECFWYDAEEGWVKQFNEDTWLEQGVPFWFDTANRTVLMKSKDSLAIRRRCMSHREDAKCNAGIYIGQNVTNLTIQGINFFSATISTAVSDTYHKNLHHGGNNYDDDDDSSDDGRVDAGWGGGSDSWDDRDEQYADNWYNPYSDSDDQFYHDEDEMPSSDVGKSKLDTKNDDAQEVEQAKKTDKDDENDGKGGKHWWESDKKDEKNEDAQEVEQVQETETGDENEGKGGKHWWQSVDDEKNDDAQEVEQPKKTEKGDENDEKAGKTEDESSFAESTASSSTTPPPSTTTAAEAFVVEDEEVKVIENFEKDENDDENVQNDSDSGDESDGEEQKMGNESDESDDTRDEDADEDARLGDRRLEGCSGHRNQRRLKKKKGVQFRSHINILYNRFLYAPKLELMFNDIDRQVYLYKNTFEFGNNIQYSGGDVEFTCNYFAFNGVFDDDEEADDWLLESTAATDALNQNTFLYNGQHGAWHSSDHGIKWANDNLFVGQSYGRVPKRGIPGAIDIPTTAQQNGSKVWWNWFVGPQTIQAIHPRRPRGIWDWVWGDIDIEYNKFLMTDPGSEGVGALYLCGEDDNSTELCSDYREQLQSAPMTGLALWHMNITHPKNLNKTLKVPTGCAIALVGVGEEGAFPSKEVHKNQYALNPWRIPTREDIHEFLWTLTLDTAIWLAFLAAATHGVRWVMNGF